MLDVAGYVLRARRRADLSQRELAGRLGVSQPLIARLEGSPGTVRLELFEAVLAEAGLRLAVVDEQGCGVAPFPRETVRDNAGRRFPAHLDVVPPDRVPANRGAGPRYDRPGARAWYARRRIRDEAVAAGEGRPGDHPTEAELAERRRELRERGRRPPALARTQDPCACPDRCFELAQCVPDCACQCESGSPGGSSLQWPP